MQSWHNPAFWLVFILLPVNWGMEARKWQLLLRPLEQVSFATAFKSVLAGCSVTMLTPNRIGEYGGRIIYVKEENRLDAIPLTILGSVSQLFVTLIMGTVGLVILKYYQGDAIFKFLPSYISDVLFFLSIAGSAFFLLIYLRAGLIVKLLGRVKRLNKFVGHILLLKTFSRKQLLRILSLSFFRYMVFILQYILLLRVMHVEIGFVSCFWLLTIFYLAMAMAPTIGFTELPVRAAVIVEMLQPFSSNVLGMQAAALGIWLINLVLPAVAGSVLFFGIKIMKEK